MGAQGYPCENCGAPLKEDSRRDLLVCPFCDSTFPRPRRRHTYGVRITQPMSYVKRLEQEEEKRQEKQRFQAEEECEKIEKILIIITCIALPLPFLWAMFYSA